MATEKRLIDANALGRNSFHIREYGYDGERCVVDWDDIESAPTVDAVEVVRCRDCRHFVQGEPYDPCECMKWKVKFGVAYTEPDGYCHKAERKDNG